MLDDRLWHQDWRNHEEGQWDNAIVFRSFRLRRYNTFHQYVQHFATHPQAPDDVYIVFQVDKNKNGNIKFRWSFVSCLQEDNVGGLGEVLETDEYEGNRGPTIAELKKRADDHKASSHTTYGSAYRLYGSNCGDFAGTQVDLGMGARKVVPSRSWGLLRKAWESWRDVRS